LTAYFFDGRWVYALGVGDTYMAEIIAIVFLSIYVYTTAIFNELTQVALQHNALVVRPFPHSSPILSHHFIVRVTVTCYPASSLCFARYRDTTSPISGS
jgi:hypothetical protein